MVKKIRVAVEARGDDDILIVARTDARTAHGLDEALRRAEAYAKAGADILFVESPESEREMEKICASFELPLMANMVEGGKTPILSAARLTELGYRIAIFPATGFLAGGRRARLRLQDLAARRLERRRDRTLVSVQRFREADGIPGRVGFR
jgi:2-methylisocitrate lyase-like PEP mutase family enzyme